MGLLDIRPKLLRFVSANQGPIVPNSKLHKSVTNSTRFHILCKKVLTQHVERLEGAFEKEKPTEGDGKDEKSSSQRKWKDIKVNPDKIKSIKAEKDEKDALEESKTESCCSQAQEKCFGGLLKEDGRVISWVNKMDQRYGDFEDEEGSLLTLFNSVKFASTNLAPYLKQEFPETRRGSEKKKVSDGKQDFNACFLTIEHRRDQNDLYRRILRALTRGLTYQDVQLNMNLMGWNRLEPFRILIPPATSLHPGYSGLQLYAEKCRFVQSLITVGFAESSIGFTDKAKVLIKAFSAQPKDELALAFDSKVDKQECKECTNWMIKEQCHMLTMVYSKTPLKQLRRLFGENQPVDEDYMADDDSVPAKAKVNEMRTMLDGADCHLAERDTMREIVLTTKGHREALAALLGGDDLRLLMSSERRAAKELGELTEEHKKNLRDLGLRGTDVIEEVMLTTINDESFVDKTKRVVVELLQKKENASELRVGLRRLRELDSRFWLWTI